jgi:energy-coupling factor transporter ATP-binding protein EcfA2
VSARSPSGVAWRLGLGLSALGLNLWCERWWLSLSLAAVALLWVLLGRGRRPPLGALWVALAAALGLALAAALGLVGEAGLLPLAARVVCGAAWSLWLAAALQWPELRGALRAAGAPAATLERLDQSWLHGVLTARQWSQRRDAARARLGRASLPASVWGAVLGEGALEGVARVEVAEQSALRRGAACGLSAEAGAVVVLEGASLRRGERALVEAQRWSLSRGAWVALCGPSGAGKSSLLRLLVGLEAPTEGQLARFGELISSASPLSRRLDGRVALLCQNPEHHFLAVTARDDIAWSLRRRGRGEEEVAAAVAAVAASLSLEQVLDRPCYGLSFGEQRRVALAGLLVAEPQLLLLDEPTAGLDPVAAGQLAGLIAGEVARRGVTCVWATHDLHQLPGEITRALFLREGRLIFDGPVSEGLSARWLGLAGLWWEGARGAHNDPCAQTQG